MFGKLLQPEAIFWLKMFLKRSATGLCLHLQRSHSPLVGFKGAASRQGKVGKWGQSGDSGKGQKGETGGITPPAPPIPGSANR